MIKKKILFSVVFTGLCTGFLLTPNLNETEASVYVTDVQNIAQNTQTAANTAANAINTANQVALAVKNLASMDSKALLAHYLGIDDQYKKIMDYLDEQVGALDLGISTDTILSEMGTNGNLYGTNMSEAQFKNNVKKLYHIEDQTYASALNVGRQQERIEDGVESLRTAIENLNSAQGEKEALQAQGQIDSQAVVEQTKTTNALLTLIAVSATKNLAENAEKQALIKKQEEFIDDSKTNAKRAIQEVEEKADNNWNNYQDIVHGRY